MKRTKNWSPLKVESLSLSKHYKTFLPYYDAWPVWWRMLNRSCFEIECLQQCGAGKKTFWAVVGVGDNCVICHYLQVSNVENDCAPKRKTYLSSFRLSDDKFYLMFKEILKFHKMFCSSWNSFQVHPNFSETGKEVMRIQDDMLQKYQKGTVNKCYYWNFAYFRLVTRLVILWKEFKWFLSFPKI